MAGAEETKMVWPNTHRLSLQALLTGVSTVLVVGWRGADQHIVEMITSHLPERITDLDLVGFDAAGVNEMQSNLDPWVQRSENVRAIAGGFRAYIGEHHGKLLDLFPPVEV